MGVVDNISTELTNIRDATYGEQVRGSIYDGIKKIAQEVDATVAEIDSSNPVIVRKAIAPYYDSNDTSVVYNIGDYVYHIDDPPTDAPSLYRCQTPTTGGVDFPGSPPNWVKATLANDINRSEVNQFRFDSANSPGILAGKSCDDLTRPGVWYVNKVDGISTLIDFPIDGPGWIRISGPNDGRIMQEVYPSDIETYSYRLFRTKDARIVDGASTTTWTDWWKIPLVPEDGHWGDSSMSVIGTGLNFDSDTAMDIAFQIAEPFTDNVPYVTGDLVVKDNVLYKFTANHAAGAWTGNDVVNTSVADELGYIEETAGNNFKHLLALEFSDQSTYAAGSYVLKDGVLYKFTSAHSGAWTGTDAETVTAGKELTDLKTDLFKYNANDVLAPNATYTSRTLNGITYTWDDARKTCTATGTPAGGNTFTNMIASMESFPVGFNAGGRYYVTFRTTSPNFVLHIIFYKNGSNVGSISITENTYIIIPDCDGIIVRLRVMGNIGGEATASNIAILTAEPNSILAKKIATNASFFTNFLKNYQGSNNTVNGVTFEWQGDACVVSGTATERANYNIIDSRQSLPDNMQVGDSFIFACDKTDIKIISQVVFYDSNGSVITSKSGTSTDVPFVIPADTVGIIVRFYVNVNVSVNGTVSSIKLVKLTSKKMSVPLIVSFVDDDTTSDELVTRYHDACSHNGVKGTYAVITKQMEDGRTQASKLLSYEDEGFGMCIHCYQQSDVSEWSATVRTEAVANACRANLAKGMRQMQELGFLNFRHWITPGGHSESDIQETAKMLGCKCLITTNNGRANLMQDIDLWHIKRISLRHDDNGTSENSLTGVKNIIDKTVSEGSGWLIITTHFNDGWSDLTWDSTLDSNGYPIGYSRFNEVVQYAINSGLMPMTIPQAWAYYEDILTANIEECNMANA